MGIVFGIYLGAFLLPIFVGLIPKLVADAYAYSKYGRASRLSWLHVVLIAAAAGTAEYYAIAELPLRSLRGFSYVTLLGLPALLVLGISAMARGAWRQSSASLVPPDRIRRTWVRAWLALAAAPAAAALLLMATPFMSDAAGNLAFVVMWLLAACAAYPFFILGSKIHSRMRG